MLIQTEYEADQQPTEASTCAAVSKVVLLVDDDQGFLLASAKILGAAGFAVLEADGFRRALEFIEGGERIDLMLTDLVMPEQVNGLALSRMARMRRPDMRILYLTAYDIPGASDEALGPILSKPIADDALVDAVRHALAARGE